MILLAVYVRGHLAIDLTSVDPFVGLLKSFSTNSTMGSGVAKSDIYLMLESHMTHKFKMVVFWLRTFRNRLRNIRRLISAFPVFRNSRSAFRYSGTVFRNARDHIFLDIGLLSKGVRDSVSPTYLESFHWFQNPKFGNWRQFWNFGTLDSPILSRSSRISWFLEYIQRTGLRYFRIPEFPKSFL